MTRHWKTLLVFTIATLALSANMATADTPITSTDRTADRDIDNLSVTAQQALAGLKRRSGMNQKIIRHKRGLRSPKREKTSLSATDNSVKGQHGSVLESVEQDVEHLKRRADTVDGNNEGEALGVTGTALSSDEAFLDDVLQDKDPLKRRADTVDGNNEGEALGVTGTALSSDEAFLDDVLNDKDPLKRRDLVDGVSQDLDTNDLYETLTDDAQKRDLVDGVSQDLDTNDLYEMLTDDAQKKKRSPVFFNVDPNLGGGSTRQQPNVALGGLLNQGDSAQAEKTESSDDTDAADDTTQPGKRSPLAGGGSSGLPVEGLLQELTSALKKRSPLAGGGSSGLPVEGLLQELTSALKKRQPLAGGGDLPVDGLVSELTDALKKRQPLAAGGGGSSPLAPVDGLLSSLTSVLKKRSPLAAGGNSGLPVEGLLQELTSALKKREPLAMGGGGKGPLQPLEQLLSQLNIKREESERVLEKKEVREPESFSSKMVKKMVRED